ncbi:hypothetical protein C4D60_Mb03t08910 [Musa balbisiana]|uniref:Uncharacterized protein n=1 Tax=Musa balbisiana TaxID=52838 RepID=A0A4S8J8N0_MUSBA|nr:hypothetical protein C4D60_Mb03t08910 [Musa balbisiana]
MVILTGFDLEGNRVSDPSQQKAIQFDERIGASVSGCGEDNPAKFLRKLTMKRLLLYLCLLQNMPDLAQIEFEKVLRKKFACRDEEYDLMLGVVREVPPELILPQHNNLTI